MNIRTYVEEHLVGKTFMYQGEDYKILGMGGSVLTGRRVVPNKEETIIIEEQAPYHPSPAEINIREFFSAVEDSSGLTELRAEYPELFI